MKEYSIIGLSKKIRKCDKCGNDIGTSGAITLKHTSGKQVYFCPDCATEVLIAQDPKDVVTIAMKKQAAIALQPDARDDDLSRVVKYFESRDPSGNKKYLKWEIYVYLSGQALEPEIADIVNLFHKYNQQLEKKDLYQYSHFDLTSLRDRLFAIRDRGVEKQKRAEYKYKIDDPDFEVIFETDKAAVRLIKNKAASLKFGSGSKWCISNPNTGYFHDYDAGNAVFIFLENKTLHSDDPGRLTAIAYYRGLGGGISDISYFNLYDEIIKKEDVIKSFPLYIGLEDKLKEIAGSRPKSLLARLGSGKGKLEDFDSAIDLANRTADQRSREVILRAVVNSSNVPAVTLEKLVDDKDVYVRSRVAESLLMSKAVLEKFSNDPYPSVRSSLLRNPSLPIEMLEKLSDDVSGEVRYGVASHKLVSEKILERLHNDRSKGVIEAISQNPLTSEKMLEDIYDNNIHIRETLANRSSLPTKISEKMSNDKDEKVRINLARNTSTSISVLDKLSDDENKDVRVALAGNPSVSKTTLEKMYNSYGIAGLSKGRGKKNRWDTTVTTQLAGNPSTPDHILDDMLNKGDREIRYRLAENPSVPIEIIDKLVYDKDSEVSEQAREKLAGNSSISDEMLKKLSDDKFDRVREKLAGNPRVSEEILDKLSSDNESWVRLSVSRNPSVSNKILEKLTHDEELYVRRGALRILEDRGALLTHDQLLLPDMLDVNEELPEESEVGDQLLLAERNIEHNDPSVSDIVPVADEVVKSSEPSFSDLISIGPISTGGLEELKKIDGENVKLIVPIDPSVSSIIPKDKEVS